MRRISSGSLRWTPLSSWCTLPTTWQSKCLHVASPDKSFSPNFALRHSICISWVILYWKVQRNKKQKTQATELMLRRTKYYLSFILQEEILIFPLNPLWLAFNLWNSNKMSLSQQDKQKIYSKRKTDHYGTFLPDHYRTFLPDWWWFLSASHMH